MLGTFVPLNLSPMLAKGICGKWVAGQRLEEDSERSERTGARCTLDLGNELSTLRDRQPFQTGFFDSRLSASSVSSRVLAQVPQKAAEPGYGAFKAVERGASLPLTNLRPKRGFSECPAAHVEHHNRSKDQRHSLDPAGCSLDPDKIQTGLKSLPSKTNHLATLAEACTWQAAVDGLAGMLSSEDGQRTGSQLKLPDKISPKRKSQTRQKLLKLFQRPGLIQKRRRQRTSRKLL